MPEERIVELPTGAIRLLMGGSGPPLVLLHHDIEGASWGELHDCLAREFTLFAPDMPGWGGSERLEWARHPRDLASVMLALGRKLGFGPCVLAGLGFGGWVAAEMAAFAPNELRGLVLIGAAGMKPDTEHVLDQVMMDHRDYVSAGFSEQATFVKTYGEKISPEQRARWEASREVIARISWKPYMYSYELPETLKNVSTPTRIVWGELDRVVPIRCAVLYNEVLPHAQIEIVPGGGHFLDLEHPERVASMIVQFSKEH